MRRNFKERRLLCGVWLRQMCAEHGLDFATMNAIERGTREPTEEEAEELDFALTVCEEKAGER